MLHRKTNLESKYNVQSIRGVAEITSILIAILGV